MIAVGVLIMGAGIFIKHGSSLTNIEVGKKVTKSFQGDQTYGVSSSNPIAVEVGMDVMKNGGNAVDAAVAISYVLGVVEPYGSGIGGGGGMLIAEKDAEPIFIDYRETAPSALQSRTTVPGLVAGMAYVNEKYGAKPIDELLQPAIDYAEQGFTIEKTLHNRLYYAQGRMPREELPTFYPNGETIAVGETLKQPKLAETMRDIQEKGKDVFYQGDIAENLASYTDISLADLKSYEVVERKPLVSTYGGHEIIAAPAPFSGATIIQMLKLAEMQGTIGLEQTNEMKYYEQMKEITDVAYEDRFETLGDLAFNNETKDLISDNYLQELLHRESNGVKSEEEHESTTHFVVIDSEGMTVSTTNTLSNFFGTGQNVSGFFLNNNGDTFAKAGVNAKVAGKRSRTHTAPVIIRDKGVWVMGIGTPGGSRIPQIMTQVILHHIEGEDTIQQAVDRPRFIFEENTMFVEEEMAANALPSSYYISIESSDVFYGGVQALIRNFETKQMDGAGDSRREGIWESGS